MRRPFNRLVTLSLEIINVLRLITVSSILELKGNNSRIPEASCYKFNLIYNFNVYVCALIEPQEFDLLSLEAYLKAF